MPARHPVTLVLLAAALAPVPAALAYDEFDPWREYRSPWLHSAARDGIVYLVDADAPRVERYDMKASSWLEPLVLPDVATAFVVDGNGLVVSTGRSLYAALPSSESFDFVANTLGDVRSLASDGESLYVSMDANPNFAVRERATGTLMERRSLHYSMRGTVVSAGHDVVLGRSAGVSPSDIVAVDLGESDDWRGQRDSDYHGDYPDAEALRLFPDGDRVLDDAGMIYSVPGLRWLGSVAGEVRGVTFEADGLHVLSGSTIRKLSGDYLERGARTLDGDVHALFGHGDELFAFGRATDGTTTVDVVPKRSVTDASPAPVDPGAVTFRADETFGTGDGSVFVMSRAHRALFRRPAGADAFDAGFRLRGEPSSIGHAPDSDALHIGYPSGAITRLDLASGVETPFANLASRVHAVVAFEGGLFASDGSGAWGSFHTFGENGAPIASVDWRNPAASPIWIGAMREILHTDHGRLVAQPVASDGTLGAERESGYDAGDAFAPLVPNPDRSLVLSGAGTIFDTASFELVESLANGIVDAVWPADDLIVSLARGDDAPWYWYDEEATEPTSFRLQQWGERREPLRTLAFDAVDASLVESGGRVHLLVLDAVPARPRIVELRHDSNDVDGDGVADAADAYPLDPARRDAEPDEVDADLPPDERDPTGWYPDPLVTDADAIDIDVEADGDFGPPPAERSPGTGSDVDVNVDADVGADADTDMDMDADADGADRGDGDDEAEPTTVEITVPDEAVEAVEELTRTVEESGAGGTGGALVVLLALGGLIRRRALARTEG